MFAVYLPLTYITVMHRSDSGKEVGWVCWLQASSLEGLPSSCVTTRPYSAIERCWLSNSDYHEFSLSHCVALFLMCSVGWKQDHLCQSHWGCKLIAVLPCLSKQTLITYIFNKTTVCFQPANVNLTGAGKLILALGLILLKA